MATQGDDTTGPSLLFHSLPEAWSRVTGDRASPFSTASALPLPVRTRQRAQAAVGSGGAGGCGAGGRQEGSSPGFVKCGVYNPWGCLLGLQSHCCRGAAVFSHKVTGGESAAGSPQPCGHWCSLRLAEPLTESRGATSSGERGRQGRGIAAAAHHLNCPPRVKLFNFSPFARLNPPLRDKSPK